MGNVVVEEVEGLSGADLLVKDHVLPLSVEVTLKPQDHEALEIGTKIAGDELGWNIRYMAKLSDRSMF